MTQRFSFTRRRSLLLALLGASIVFAGCVLYQQDRGANSASYKPNASLLVINDPSQSEPGCTQWLVYKKTGTVMNFWNANGSIAYSQRGSGKLSRNIALAAPEGTYIKYIAYGAVGAHQLQVKLTNTLAQDTPYAFNEDKNNTPYRLDEAMPDTSKTIVSFPGGTTFKPSDSFWVTYCPVPSQG